MKAQNALSSCFSLYLFSSRLLLPDLLPLLGNDGLVSHDQFKVRPQQHWEVELNALPCVARGPCM